MEIAGDSSRIWNANTRWRKHKQKELSYGEECDGVIHICKTSAFSEDNNDRCINEMNKMVCNRKTFIAYFR